jgi:hypothetical protein
VPLQPAGQRHRAEAVLREPSSCDGKYPNITLFQTTDGVAPSNGIVRRIISTSAVPRTRLVIENVDNFLQCHFKVVSKMLVYDLYYKTGTYIAEDIYRNAHG